MYMSSPYWLNKVHEAMHVQDTAGCDHSLPATAATAATEQNQNAFCNDRANTAGYDQGCLNKALETTVGCDHICSACNLLISSRM